MEKTALIIAYPFPPYGSVATLRTTKYVQYLSEYGWDVIVLTVKNPVTSYLDETLLDSVPKNIPIYRAKAFQPTAFYFSQKRASNQNKQGATTPQSGIVAKIKKVIRTIGRIGIQYTMIPDDRIGWVPFALKKAREIIDNHQVDVIYTTAGPFSTNIIGSRLTQKTGIPWVADFRDPYVGYGFLKPSNPFHKYLRKLLENNWVHNAKRVISVTDHMSRDFANRYPNLSTEKWQTITNGYDAESFSDIVPSLSQKVFYLRHLGTLYKDGTPSLIPLLYAIKKMINTKSHPAQDFRFELIGKIDQVHSKELHETVEALALSNIVHILPSISHKDAIQSMCDSHVLMVGLANKPGLEVAIRAKIFEYLHAQRPILGLMSAGAAHDLLTQMQGAVVFEPTDSEGIYNTLSDWYDLWREKQLPHPKYQNHEKFERKALTERLAKIFDDVIE